MDLHDILADLVRIFFYSGPVFPARVPGIAGFPWMTWTANSLYPSVQVCNVKKIQESHDNVKFQIYWSDRKCMQQTRTYREGSQLSRCVAFSEAVGFGSWISLKPNCAINHTAATEAHLGSGELLRAASLREVVRESKARSQRFLLLLPFLFVHWRYTSYWSGVSC